MTTVPPSASPNKKEAQPVKKVPPAAAKKKSAGMGFFHLEAVAVDVIENEGVEQARYTRLARIVTWQTFLLAALCGVLILSLPFLQPIYHYYAINPAGQAIQLAPLMMPNMTNRAIISWSTSSVTEVMTFGFGDFESKLVAQKKRFTPSGWDAFVRAFLNDKIGESFRQHQLVLTTVPSDVPIIVSQGENEKHIYQWKVQMPVIMTYATNNNKTRPERALIDLTIVRVPYAQSVAGIAIDSWKQGHF